MSAVMEKAAVTCCSGTHVCSRDKYPSAHSLPKFYAEAVIRHRKSAEQGDASGQNNLGLLFHGLGGLRPSSYIAVYKRGQVSISISSH
jgi:TPR repeat protein